MCQKVKQMLALFRWAPAHAEPLLVFSLIVAAEKLRIVLDKKQPRWRKKVSIARQLAA